MDSGRHNNFLHSRPSRTRSHSKCGFGSSMEYTKSSDISARKSASNQASRNLKFWCRSPLTGFCLVLGAALQLTDQLWFRSKGNEHTTHSGNRGRPQSLGRRANGSPVGHLSDQPRRRQLSVLRHPIQCAPQRLLATAAGSAGPGHTGHDPATGCASSVPRWRLSAAIFGKRVSGVAEPRFRRTCRVLGLIHLLGHTAGGKPGERLPRRLGFPASDDTAVHHLKRRARSALETTAQIRVVGIDDWAWRKGQT
jgi:hypothetical protein